MKEGWYLHGKDNEAIAYIKDVNIPDNTKFDITIGKMSLQQQEIVIAKTLE